MQNKHFVVGENMSGGLSENKIRQKSDGKYDIMKFILSIFIVATHTQLFPSVLFPWLRIAVPLFFITSSYFLFKKIIETPENKDKNILVKNYVKRNLQLYGFWLVVLLPRIIYNRRDVFADSIFKGVVSLVRSFLFAGVFSASWYIMASIIGVLIVFFLAKRLDNKALLIISAIIYLFVVIDASYKFAFSKDSAVYHIITTYTRIFASPVYSFTASLFWVTCGKCFAEKTFKSSRKIYIIISVVSAVLLYGEWLFVEYKTGEINNDCYFGLMPFCIGLFGLIKSLPPVYFEKSIYLRHCSTFIYPAHPMVLTIVSAIYRYVFDVHSSTLNFITVTVLCICAYLVVEWLLRKKPKNKLVRLLKYSY